MDSQRLMTSTTCLQPKRKRCPSTNPSWIHHRTTRNCIKFRSIKSDCCYLYRNQQQQQQKKKSMLVKASAEKAKSNGLIPLKEEPAEVVDEKKGTIAGAVALIIGTSIGSGILALPQKALPAGLLPSSISLIVCWAFLLIEALLLVEINVNLRRRKGKKQEEMSDLEVISIRTMARETLGDFGGTLATLTYVFLGYTSMIAYSSKSGEILLRLINLPAPISGFIFTSIFTLLISLGGTRATDQVNQFLTVSMIGLLVLIEVLAVVFGGWSGLEESGDWGKVPAMLPVMIFSLVYHDLAPVLCAYLNSDLTRLRISVFLGSLVPLIALLVWDAIVLGLSASSDQIVDPVDLLMSVRWSGVSYMVEAFSLLAIGTSMIGTLLGFSEFFKEQLSKISWDSNSPPMPQTKDILFGLREWLGKHKISLAAMSVAVVPSLFVSTAFPDAFSAATDIAGGYCMTILYGVLPPAMAWAMHSKKQEDFKQKALSKARPVLVGAGLFACGIVAEQILLDILLLQS